MTLLVVEHLADAARVEAGMFECAWEADHVWKVVARATERSGHELEFRSYFVPALSSVLSRHAACPAALGRRLEGRPLF